MSEPEASAPLVRREDRDRGVRLLVLADPRRRNALSGVMISALEQELAAAASNRSVRVLVLGAEGPVFSSGHDLRELRALAGAGSDGELSDEQLDRCRPIFVQCSRMMASIVRLPKPVIAAVQGLATAAGCQLAASCDLVVAAESAAFATPGVTLGLFCSTPAVALARAVGRKAAMEMLLTGERIDAERARELGLVNRVVADGEVEERAVELAQGIASRSSRALALGKEAFYRQLDLDLERAYELTSETMARNLLHRDAIEGIDAFFEKRPAKWST